jgi:hypothetical protein
LQATTIALQPREIRSLNIPLEISMISKEEYLQTVSDIEKDIRKKVEQEYQTKLTYLNNKIAAQNISEELYKQEYQILQRRGTSSFGNAQGARSTKALSS